MAYKKINEKPKPLAEVCLKPHERSAFDALQRERDVALQVIGGMRLQQQAIEQQQQMRITKAVQEEQGLSRSIIEKAGYKTEDGTWQRDGDFLIRTK